MSWPGLDPRSIQRDRIGERVEIRRITGEYRVTQTNGQHDQICIDDIRSP